MASRSQSAVEYINNARTHLENGGLQNVSVIVKNLFKRAVFTEEEVSKINSEKDDSDKTRTLLDLVTNKGEAACYELLKNIHKVTRGEQKRSLLFKTPVSEEAASTSSQKSSFNLHHWISCFFFIDAVEFKRSKGSTVWFIKLSGQRPERKVSDLLEALKLQPEKKRVRLTVWSDKESEVRTFLQCLPYISQLSVARARMSETTEFLGMLFCEAAEQEEETGEKILESLSSLCNYKTFPLIDWRDDWEHRKYQCDALLDLYSYVKNYETQTGRSVLPALQPVYQSVPTVWFIDLSERKVSDLLEVLKLQPEKKPVQLIGRFLESEVRIFLWCLPYISQLRLDLSRTRLDQKVCRGLALVLEHSEGLTHLDLSYCELTDQLLETLIPHLHKAQVLDLSYNRLTDALTDRLVQLPSINTSIQTVRLFNNRFKDTTPFLRDKHFDLTDPFLRDKRFEMMEAWYRVVASTTLYQKQLKGHSSQESLQEIIPPSVAPVSPLPPMLPSSSISQPSSQHPPEEMSRETAFTSTTDRDETDLSSSFSGLKMRKSSSLPRSHSLTSLSQSPGMENKAGFTAKRSHSLNDVILLDKAQKITPDIIVVENKESYRLHCTQAGLFQCSVTDLVFKMEAGTSVTYSTVPWNRRLRAHLGKRPAGPLFDIQCPQGSASRLHLPHCEILSMGGGKSLYVAHVTDDGIEFIKPDVITETHVIINITEFSPFGVVTGFKELVGWLLSSSPDPSSPSPTRALVLPFYTPPTDDYPRSILKVLLLPGNVVLDEVLNVRRKRDLHGEEIYIEVPPCKLIPNQEYTLSTSPQHDSILIQPKKETFEVEESSYINYMPTFELILKERFEEVTLLLKDGNTSESDRAWEHCVSLSSQTLRRQKVERTLSLEVEDRLLSVRSNFIDSISAPSLKRVVDKLFANGTLNEAERETAEEMKAREGMARFVIDTVRRKGPDASSSMILILCNIDPRLSEHLGLM